MYRTDSGHGDSDVVAIANPRLKPVLPTPTPIAIAAPGVCQYREVTGCRIASPSFRSPPLLDGIHGEVQGVVRGTNEHCPAVREQIVDAVGDCDKVTLRGDTDFSQTKHLDRWDEQEVEFVFGMPAMKNLVEIADNLSSRAWNRLERRPKYEVKTVPRQKPENVKEAIVQEREYKNIHRLNQPTRQR